MLEQIFQFPTQTVRLIYCADVARFLAELQVKRVSQLHTTNKVVVCNWDRLAGITTIIEDAVHRLAEASLAAWPDWSADAMLDSDCRERGLPPCSVSFESQSRILLPWFEQATQQCSRGVLPIPCGFPNEIHAAQLALTLASTHLTIILSTTDLAPPQGALMSLARTAEWLCRATSMPVAMIVPHIFATNSELDSVNSGAVHLNRDDEVGSRRHDSVEKTRLLILPFIGHPHPNSPGEQLLARRLSADSELGGLFEFNQYVSTFCGSRYIVDLLWRDGKVVVEVDGFHLHTSPVVFASDRQRDYELLLDRYSVLRVTHEEVMADVERVVSKIRDVVALKRRIAPMVTGDQK